MNQSEERRFSVDTKELEIRTDRLGRRINPKSLRALQAHKFKPGQSGNPGGNYKRRPFTDAIAIVATMRVKDLKILPTDSVPVVMAKSLFMRGIEGNVAAFTELANRLEGKPTQRAQYENVPGTAVQVSGNVGVRSRDLVRTLREIYGLNDPESEKRRAQSSAGNRLM